MARRRLLASFALAGMAATVALAGTQGIASAKPKPTPAKPTKVVIILVDALSREIVDKYGMSNVQALMDVGVDTPRGYLGHTGSVTVVTHNVITSGLLPKHMGWTNEGYRDSLDVLPDRKATNAGDNLFISSNWTSAEMFPVQNKLGYPKLGDYLAKSGGVYTVSPKAYAAYGFSGDVPGTTTITFGGTVTCGTAPNTQRYRIPVGINLPSWLDTTCGSRWLVERDKGYDTLQEPARLYPALDDRYVVGDEAGHQGGDVWATDLSLRIMQEDEDWSGLFISLPGVDKAAHMWGGVNDPEGGDLDGDGQPDVIGYNELTHMEYATATADAQVGRIMDALEESGDLDDTVVVLTADHGSVAAAEDHFHGDFEPVNDYGLWNWYYGDVENDVYLDPQEALKPLVEEGNVGLSYSDSSINVWLKDQSPEAAAATAEVMATLPDVTAVWHRNGDHFDRVSPVRWERMTSPGEKAWFVRKAQELVDTQAADYGPDLVATLPDDTTYSVHGDHGGIQRSTQQIPIVFAGGGLSSKDLHSEVRSVDIMPTLLRTLGIEPDAPMDGVAYKLPME